MSEQRPTSAAALRAKSRETLTNPDTGNTYIVRRSTAETMIKSGHLPDDFFFEQAKLITSEDESADDSKTEKLDAEKLVGFKDDNLLRMEQITRAVVSTCLFNPRVVVKVENEDDEGVIEYEDIPASDRQYIRAWYEYRLPDQKIELKSGTEVTRQEVANFPIGERQSELDRTGNGRAAAS